MPGADLMNRYFFSSDPAADGSLPASADPSLDTSTLIGMEDMIGPWSPGASTGVIDPGYSAAVNGSSAAPDYEGIANSDNVQAAMAEFGLSAAAAMQANQLFNAAEAEKQREAAFQLVKYQLDRQEDFSKNAVYYRMQDLKRSGINPVLAFQGGGAQLPSSASAGLSAASSTYQGGDTASTMIKAFSEYGSYYAKMIEAISGAVNGLLGSIAKGVAAVAAFG